jgi:hypothetical protein
MIDAVKLAEEVNSLYESIKQPLDRTPEGLIAEIDFRCQWLARSSEILADCQIILDKKRGEVSTEYIATKDGWNIVKAVIESRCAEEKKLFMLADRLNATLTHQIDGIRSMLSFEKESAKMNRNYGLQERR